MLIRKFGLVMVMTATWCVAGCGSIDNSEVKNEEAVDSANTANAAIAEKQAEKPAVVEAKVEGDSSGGSDSLSDAAAKALAEKLAEEEAYRKDFQPIEERELIELNFDVTDQEGKAFKISDLFGKPMAVSFVFTSCKNVNMCPMVASKMASLQRNIKKSGMGDEVNVVLISFDPKRDTPERMKAWAGGRGLKFDNGMMLRPAIEQMPAVQEMMEIRVSLDNPDDHMIDLMLIDAEGGLVRNLGGIWSNKLLLEDIAILVKENQEAKAKAKAEDKK